MSAHMSQIRLRNRCVTYAYVYVTVTNAHACHMSSFTHVQTIRNLQII